MFEKLAVENGRSSVYRQSLIFQLNGSNLCLDGDSALVRRFSPSIAKMAR